MIRPPDIELRHLRMVTALEVSGTLTRAAEALYVTPSALSHQLRDVEERLGTALYLRVGKRLVLTPAGERVLAMAHRVLEEVSATEALVRQLSTEQDAVIRVCAQCNTGYHWLPAVVQTFRRTHPRVHVALSVEHTARPLDALLDGRLDLAIVTEPVAHAACIVRPLFEDEHAAVVAPDHPFASRAFVRPEDFAGERLLLYSSSPEESFTVQKILKPARVEPLSVSFVMLTEALLEMVKARLGVSVMQTWAIAPALRAGEVRAVPITPGGIHRRWFAVTLKAAGRRPHVEAFVDSLSTRALPARAPRHRLRADGRKQQAASPPAERNGPSPRRKRAAARRSG
jgi:LysR family transcriptional regulator for metE and metH